MLKLKKEKRKNVVYKNKSLSLHTKNTAFQFLKHIIILNIAYA